MNCMSPTTTRSLDNAVLVGANVYSRDVITGDSSLVFADALVRIAYAHDYAVTHPNSEHPLEPDDPEPDHPSVWAMSDVSLITVHGPFLSMEYHAELRRRRENSWHSAWRQVVDLRGARQPLLKELIGAQAANGAVEQGKRYLAQALDAAHGGDHQLSELAESALSQVHFDERSFSIADTNGEPAVTFAARVAAGEAARSIPLALPAVPVAPPRLVEGRASNPRNDSRQCAPCSSRPLGPRPLRSARQLR